MTPAGKTVLVVDDEPAVRHSLALLLKLSGFEAVTAADGAEALRYLEGHPAPSVIVLDVMMPVMDGTQFRRVQRQDPRLAAIPVVVCSARADLEDHPDLRDAAAFHAKPAHPDRLLDSIRSLCV
jgi:CheY-like chemotaxis protein